MLRSAGYFIGVQCPSEKEVSGCSRPYCPFRHNTSTKRAGTSSQKESIASATEFIDNEIEKIKCDIANTRNAAASYGEDDFNPILDSSYDPEPYTPFDGQGTSSGVYNPTVKSTKKGTKSVLHGARGPSKSTQSWKAPRTKNIYRSKSMVQPATDMEYDPVVNYSTAIKDKLSSRKGALSDKYKRAHSSGDYGEVPEKKSKVDFIDDEKAEDNSDLQDPFSASEDDTDDSFVIDEGDEPDNHGAVEEIFGTESGSDTSSTEAEKCTKDDVAKEKVTKDRTDKSINTVIEITSDDEHPIENDARITKNEIIDLTDDKNIDKTKPIKKGKKHDKVTKKQTKVLSNKHEKSKVSTVEKSKSDDKVTRDKATTKVGKEEKIKGIERRKKESKGLSEKNYRAKVKKSEMKVVKKKNGVLTAKDIDTSQITNYVDRDEIKKLEKELESGDTFEECLRIYQEGSEKPSGSKSRDDNEAVPIPVASPSEVPEEPETAVGKRRVAHTNASTHALSIHKPRMVRKRISTPAQMMMKRLEVVEEEKARSMLSGKSSSSRVAHKMSNRMAALAKSKTESRMNIRRLEKKMQENPWYPAKDNNEPTVCGTATKGVARVAHESKETFFAKNGSIVPPRPRIAVERHSKVPTNIRQRYLTTFIDECLRIFNQRHEKAYEMALAEEGQCKKRSNTKNIYLSLAASTLKKLRGMPACEVDKTKVVAQSTPTKVRKLDSDATVSMGKSRKPISHDKLLDTNTKKCKGGYTIEKREKTSEFSHAELYEKMCRYIMTPEQLDQNGYPRPCDVPGKAEFRSDPPPKPFNNTDKKICAHCGREFFLDKKGRFSRVEECIYHWGRAYMTRVGKGWEKRYSCCQERQGVEGCSIGDTHVHADNKLDRSGYVRTLSKSPPPDGDCGIFTLDCEMSYTVNGLDLTRVSVLDSNCKLIYDTFVKPSGRVLDYNTRWSGITEDDMKNVTTTIRDVQAAFLTKFSADTILMGHSLESDLIALRIIHETVIDTAIVFPHKRGPPYKRSLKNVASENLGLIIQTGATEGHDSAEDAAACMKLMMWKVKEDAKLSHK